MDLFAVVRSFNALFSHVLAVNECRSWLGGTLWHRFVGLYYVMRTTHKFVREQNTDGYAGCLLRQTRFTPFYFPRECRLYWQTSGLINCLMQVLQIEKNITKSVYLVIDRVGYFREMCSESYSAIVNVIKITACQIGGQFGDIKRYIYYY